MKWFALLAAFAITSVHATDEPGFPPSGWFVATPNPGVFDVRVESVDPIEGETCASLASGSASPAQFATLMQAIDAKGFRGKRVRLSGQLRAKEVGSAWLWLRADREEGTGVAFDNMAGYTIQGTVDWSYTSVVLDIPEEAAVLAYGFALSGTGKVWADALNLEIVTAATPITAEPKPGRPKSPVSPARVAPSPANMGLEL